MPLSTRATTPVLSCVPGDTATVPTCRLLLPGGLLAVAELLTISAVLCFFFQAEDGIRDGHVTGVQTCALPISASRRRNSGQVAQSPTRLELASSTRGAHSLVRSTPTGLPDWTSRVSSSSSSRRVSTLASTCCAGTAHRDRDPGADDDPARSPPRVLLTRNCPVSRTASVAGSGLLAVGPQQPAGQPLGRLAHGLLEPLPVRRRGPGLDEGHRHRGHRPAGVVADRRRHGGQGVGDLAEIRSASCRE